MELEIQIIRDPCRDQNKQRLRLFGAGGGSIGRSPENYWALPDPKCYVSGQHCEVEFEGEAFWLRDTSRNGVFVNDATERVGYGHRIKLGDGDRLRLGLYELLVRLRDHGRLIGGNPVDAHAAAVGSESFNDHVAAHTMNLPPGLVDDGDAGQLPIEQQAVDDNSSAPVAAPEVEPEPALAREAAAAPPTAVHAHAAADLPLSSTGSHRVVHFDRVRLREIGLLPPEAQERLIANQFRHIKRTLLANAFGKGIPAVANGRLLMMTSALPAEGKTFSTINLALSMAREKDLEVLVVDADVAKPQVSGLFRLEKERGLLDALIDDEIDAESLVLRTDVKGLSILPAGRCSEDLATELLASTRMETTVARLGARYPNRMVLFDSSPLLLTNESRVIASVVGQIVLVVRAGVTPQQAVMEAIGYIGDDKPVGIVLNQSKASGPGNYYGYGAYGYGEYGSKS